VASDNDEEVRLRAVVLQNAQSILVARRRAEDALRQQSEWLRTTLASIGDAVITTDADGRVTFMNAVAQALTGWSQTDALGRLLPDIFQIVHEDTREQVENPAIRALQTGAIIRLANHTVLLARTGEEHSIDDSAAPIRDEAGNTVGAVLVFRDVSERRRTDLARAHLAAIVESSDDAIVSKTLQSVILSWNKGAERLFGYSVDEAIGQPITMLIPPDRLGEEQQILERIIRGEHIEHFETVRVCKDGRRIDISLTISPIRDAGGAIIGASKVARDISHRKSLEARNIELRQREQLARQEAEAANRAKDEFLAMLGHELRNPLSPILTALQLMKLRGGGLEREREVIERQVGHLTRLVDDLLDVSRITRGKVALKEELVAIAEVVAKAIEIATPLLDQRTHVLDVDVPRNLLVRGDSVRLSQVFSNLLTNAAKYTPPGGRITVRATEERGKLVIRVRDTGIGIAPDVLPKVFDLFVQERQAIDRSQGGLGLGLTIVRNLVERHGGTVSAHSDGPGAGSEFVVRLPRSNPSVELEATGDLKSVSESAVTPSDAALKILVVDDSIDGAEMLAAALSAKGYETQVAFDGPTALRIAAEFRPAIVFLDIGLPVMDGYELAACLRDLPELKGIRLFALTGYGQESDRQNTRDAGFDHHFTKPIDLDVIESVLSDHSSSDSRADNRASAPSQMPDK
jgi:PAS domain S-box-containing protein